MKKNFCPSVLLILSLLIPASLRAQYWGERVLEKSFEATSFFFAPNYLNPYGIGNYKSTTPGLLNDPLLDFAVNPSHLSLDSSRSAYLYTDFRSARNVKQNETNYILPWIYATDRVASSLAYYPRLYVNSRRELEPVFSGAAVVRPLPSLSNDLYVGASYQMVMQDEKYYDIPQDIYRAVAGYDYSGRSASAAANMPIVDKYSGQDNMHSSGHFFSGFVRCALPFGLEVGGKISRVTFDRSGSFGSSNLWQYSPYSTGTSLYSSMEARDQKYSHWDAGGGVSFRVSDRVTLGASGGYLWGNATQAMRNNDTSFYSYNSSSYNSYYTRSAVSLKEWRHKGTGVYYGGDVRAQLNPAMLFTAYYQRQQTDVNITLGSNILDTSYSTYSWDNSLSSQTSLSRSYLSDVRTGGGKQKVTSNRFAATLQWNINQRVSLSFGAFWDWQEQSMNTLEAVQLSSRSRYWYTDATYDYGYAQAESKDLLWTFTTKRTNFQIPIFLTVKATDAFEVMFGLNRNAAWWSIDDVTLALFAYRNSMNNGQEQKAENFGERYTEPREEISDIRTTFLAGLAVTPVESLKLRLLMVPNFHDTYDGSELEQLQWWITLTVTP
jgi:hypothetical protein